jgi:hypothetical protein
MYHKRARTLLIDQVPVPLQTSHRTTMRYSILFLGLIAVTSGTPITTTTTTTDSCQTPLQTFLAPLANDPAAAKFCAAKYPTDPSTAISSTANIKSNNP